MVSTSAGQEPVHALAGERRDGEHRRVADEVEAIGDLVLDVVAAVGVEQLPLVEHDDDRAPGDVDALGEALVLGGHARRCRR